MPYWTQVIARRPSGLIATPQTREAMAFELTVADGQLGILKVLRRLSRRRGQGARGSRIGAVMAHRPRDERRSNQFGCNLGIASGWFEKPRDPSLDRRSQLDLSAVDEQRNFPDADSTQTNSSPVLPATVNSEHGLTSAGGRRCRARGRYACRASVSVTARFLTGFGVRLDTEGRRDQVNTLPNPDRPAVSLEQRERPGIMIQETPHGLGNRLGLVARVSGFRLPLQSGR